LEISPDANVPYFLPFDPFFWLELFIALTMADEGFELLWSDRLLFTGGSLAPFFFFFISLMDISCE
jgi:hypothetical protein